MSEGINRMLLRDIFDAIPKAKITDVPIQVPISHYHKAIDLLIDHWKSLREPPMAIYQCGQIAAPGISDIDFIVVYEDGVNFDVAQFEPYRFPTWVQQLFRHSPYFCCISTWKELPAWFPIFNLQHLWGAVLPEPVLADIYKPGVALGMLVDYFIVKIPRDILWIAIERPVRLRTLLCMLHSIKYIVYLASMADTPVSQKANEVIDNVNSLRLDWFNLDATERMGQMAALGQEVCCLAGEQIALLDKNLLKTIGFYKQSNLTLGDSSSLFFFRTPWSFSEEIGMAIAKISRTGELAWVSPYSFTQVLALYVDECPRLGRYLFSKCDRVDLFWNGGYWNDGLRYHARAMTTYRECMAKKKVPSQQYIALGYLPLPLSLRLKKYIKRIFNAEIGKQEIFSIILRKMSKIRTASFREIINICRR